MHRLCCRARHYLKTMDFADMAALKICLLSLGALIGLFIPSKSRKSAVLLMGLLFAGTYVPLMSRFFASLCEDSES